MSCFFMKVAQTNCSLQSNLLVQLFTSKHNTRKYKKMWPRNYKFYFFIDKIILPILFEVRLLKSSI